MRARAATSSGSLGLVGWRAARRRPARLRARGAPRSLSRDASSRSSLLALLAHGAALELELDVPELDDVVVDQVVLLHLLVVHEGAVRAVEVGDLELPALVAEGGGLAGDLLVGEDDVAVGRRAEHVLPGARPEIFPLVLPVQGDDPAANLAALVLRSAALLSTELLEVEHRGTLAGAGHRHRGGRGAPSGHHRLLHLQAVRAGVPARMHDVAVGADLALLFVLLEERQDPVEKLQEQSFSPPAGREN